MVKLRKKWSRTHKPKFLKAYEVNQQDEEGTEKIRLLQEVYTQIAKEIFGKIRNYHFGEWMLKMKGIVLFVDPEYGMQAEIYGTSKLPLVKRLKIHIALLKLLKEGYCILKAVKICILMLMKL